MRLRDWATIRSPSSLGGWCYLRITPPCPIGALCDTGYFGVPATLSGRVSEAPGENSLHLGTCDPDPAPQGVRIHQSLKIPRIDVTIEISGFRTKHGWLRFPSAPGAETVFPTAGPQMGSIFVDQVASPYDGYTALWTRLLSRCPTNGRFDASLDPFDFVVL